EMQAVITPPRDEPKELRPAEPKAKQPAPKQAVQKKTEQQKEQKQAARPAPSNPADAASGSGKRAVASDPNYKGRVSAHLRRFQQYPPAARNAGIQGAGTVRFTLGASGSVSSASVVRSTGNGILDQELTAMVRRASPFPAPPPGQPTDFSITVNWN